MDIELERQKQHAMLEYMYCMDVLIDFCLPRKNGKARADHKKYSNVSQDVRDMMAENLK